MIGQQDKYTGQTPMNDSELVEVELIKLHNRIRWVTTGEGYYVLKDTPKNKAIHAKWMKLDHSKNVKDI